MIYTLLGLIRDITKGLYLVIIQFFTRLCYIEREFPSSVSLNVRLDVIPRAANHERHRLVLKRKALIETRCVVNTWHGDIILEERGVIGIGSIVIGPALFGEGSGCGQNCFICAVSHLYQDTSINFKEQGLKVLQVVIEKNVWIGSNSVILPGVRIGSNSVVGAGSVVVNDIPSYSVALGNPARVVKRYDFETRQWIKT